MILTTGILEMPYKNYFQTYPGVYSGPASQRQHSGPITEGQMLIIQKLRECCVCGVVSLKHRL